MKRNEWTLQEKQLVGKTLYQVYRLIDPDKPDARTNRETAGGWYENKWCAEKLRDALNKED